MTDYTWPSIYLAYLMFAILAAGALLFFIRSFHDGYWGAHSEEPKFRMLHDKEETDHA